jgi:maleate isomerase
MSKPLDALGWRRKYAVLVPSTNTVVQPELDDLRPPGVTHHVSRIRIPNIALKNSEDFARLIELIAAAQDEAVDSVLSCEPDHLVLGISVETFWNGRQASQRLHTQLVQRTGLPVTMGAQACGAALAHFKAQRIAVLTPAHR